MGAKHDQLYEKALDAMRDLFVDESVDGNTADKSLEKLQQEIEIRRAYLNVRKRPYSWPSSLG